MPRMLLSELGESSGGWGGLPSCSAWTHLTWYVTIFLLIFHSSAPWCRSNNTQFDLPDIPLLILITSTHGRGDPPPTMLPLWTALLRTSLPPDILEDVNFACFGLGDSSYERFCYAGKVLARRMEGLGAMKLGEPAWGDERAPNG